MLYHRRACAAVSTLIYVACTISTPAPDVRQHNVWKSLAPIATGVRQEQGTVALGNKIYLIGGTVPDPSNLTQVVTVPHLDEYDIPTDRWSRKADAPWPVNHPNVESANGNIYLLGGLSAGQQKWAAQSHAAVYDPQTDSWSKLPNMPAGTARGSASTVTAGSKIYLVGGMEYIELTGAGKQRSVATVQAYDTDTGTWEDLPPLPQARDHGGAAIVDGVFWQVGGRYNGAANPKGTVFSLDLSQPSEWQTRYSQMPTPRSGLAADAVGSVVYTFGGVGNPAPDSNGIYPDVEAYDTRNDTWVQLPGMPNPRQGTAARTVGGAIYIPGGGSGLGGLGENCINTAFIP